MTYSCTHTLEECLENTARLLVDEARDTLHTTTASETADSGLGDTLNVITKDLAMALGTALSESLSSDESVSMFWAPLDAMDAPFRLFRVQT